MKFKIKQYLLLKMFPTLLPLKRNPIFAILIHSIFTSNYKRKLLYIFVSGETVFKGTV